jgi:hypothetical protein
VVSISDVQSPLIPADCNITSVRCLTGLFFKRYGKIFVEAIAETHIKSSAIEFPPLSRNLMPSTIEFQRPVLSMSLMVGRAPLTGTEIVNQVLRSPHSLIEGRLRFSVAGVT